MQHLCSRAGSVVITAGVFALLSLPVVALAKGPPEVVGGGTDTAQGVASPGAGVPDTPPGQLHNSENAVQPAPRPKPTPPGKAKSQGQAATPAPTGQAPPSGVPGAGRGNGHAYGHTGGHGHKGHGPKTPAVPAQPAGEPAPDSPGSAPGGGGGGEESRGGADKPAKSPDEPDATGPIELPSLSDAPDGAEQDIASALASETVELPEDASPETLPFTGLQAALIALAGLAAIAAGATLRLGAERRRA
jgi:hypothetical protein